MSETNLLQSHGFARMLLYFTCTLMGGMAFAVFFLATALIEMMLIGYRMGEGGVWISRKSVSKKQSK
jgi:hypothetical protein